MCQHSQRADVISQLRWLGNRSSPLLSSAGTQSSPCHLAGSASGAPSLWLGGAAHSVPVPCWDMMVLSPCWMRHPPSPRPRPPRALSQSCWWSGCCPPPARSWGSTGMLWQQHHQTPVPNEMPEPSITSLLRPPIGHEPDEVTEGTLRHHHLRHHHHHLGMPPPREYPLQPAPPSLASPSTWGPV